MNDLINKVMRAKDELIVVDNDSPHKEELESFMSSEKNLQKPNVHFYSLSNNLGFGKAVNFVANKANGEYICLVNPDCRIEQTGFADWVASFNHTPFSILAPRICYPDGSPQPNLGGFAKPMTFVMQFLKVGALLRRLNILKFLVGLLSQIKFILPAYIKNYITNFNHSIANNVNADWVSGAFMVINKNDFLEVDGFDDNFFMYCEDEDLCRRLHQKNKSVIWSPHFTVIHTVGATDKSKKNNLSLAQKERYFSTLYYIKKWFGIFYFHFFKILYFVGFMFFSFFNLCICNIKMAQSQFSFAFKALWFKRKVNVVNNAKAANSKWGKEQSKNQWNGDDI
jgi:GT2 family glycosyltransferase